MTREEAGRLIDELFETWYPSLFRYVLRLTHSVEMAEDVVQETLMQLYIELARGRRVENAKAWTLCVVRRELQRQVRRHSGTERAREPFDIFDPPGPGQLDPGLAALQHEEILGLFSSLSPREEEVLLLRLEGMKYREIGARLSISANSVNTLLARALRKLRAKVNGCPAEQRRAETAARNRVQKPLQ